MQISDKIRNSGLKVTPQRKMIYEIINDLSHASIEDIIKEVQQRDSEMTISTIYRVLTSFCDNNLIGRINHPDGKIYYDVNTHDHHHIFTSKQRLIDIDDPELTEMIRKRITGHLVDDEQIMTISVQITTKSKTETK